MTDTTQITNKTDIKDKKNLSDYIVNLMFTQSDFENNLSQNIRRSKGVFFTNELHIIDNINKIIKGDENILNKKILEPACGHGIFLLHLILEVYSLFPNKKSVHSFIENC
ncbi:TPA: hypothetical protein ACT9ME_001584, partial [Legionella pneumophila]